MRLAWQLTNGYRYRIASFGNKHSRMIVKTSRSAALLKLLCDKRLKAFSLLAFCFISYTKSLPAQLIKCTVNSPEITFIAQPGYGSILVDSTYDFYCVGNYCFEREIYFDSTFSQIVIESKIIQDTINVREYNRKGDLVRIRKLESVDSSCESFKVLEEKYFFNDGSLRYCHIRQDDGSYTDFAFYEGQILRCYAPQCDEFSCICGDFTTWWKNGNLKSKVHYSSCGMKSGKWQFYNKHGKIYRVELYDVASGKLLQTKRKWWIRSLQESN